MPKTEFWWRGTGEAQVGEFRRWLERCPNVLVGESGPPLKQKISVLDGRGFAGGSDSSTVAFSFSSEASLEGRWFAEPVSMLAVGVGTDPVTGEEVGVAD